MECWFHSWFFVALVGLAVGGVFSGGCGGTYCAPPSGQGPGSCGVDGYCAGSGECEPVATSSAMRASRFFDPSDWATTRADRPSTVIESDEAFTLGGQIDRVLFVEFPMGELHFAAEVVEAVLLLSPPNGSSNQPERVQMTVSATSPFAGEQVTHRASPNGSGPSSAHTLHAGARALARIDVTAIVARAQNVEANEVGIRIRAEGPELDWVGPRGVPERLRPRLWVTTR